MSTRAERRRAVRTGGADVAPTAPAWSTVALAVLGLIVSGYLTWTKLSGAQALLCSGHSSCDIVQASRYSTMLGLPTALWGLGLYVVLGVLAWRRYTRDRWLLALIASSAAVAFSAYLTAVSLFVLRAACPYCLVSAALEVLILADVIRWWRRVPGARASWPVPRVALASGAAAVLTVLLALGAFAVSPASASPYQVALARHLAATRAVMYGAFWCPHCQEQKEMFAGAASMLPYVECDANGAGARPDLCERAAVKSFPTWVIGDQRLEGTQSLDTLARASRFPGP
jgi:uncharacterized membrane protein/glutaredoxin